MNAGMWPCHAMPARKVRMGDARIKIIDSGAETRDDAAWAELEQTETLDSTTH